MRSDEERKLDRWLSGSAGPSVNEREQMLQRILSGTPRDEAQSRWSGWLRFGLPALAGAAACLLLFVYWNTENGGFTARGDGRAGFRVACIEAKDAASEAGNNPSSADEDVRCRLGDTLLLIATPPEKGLRFLSAAALGPEGTLIWYFPSAERASLLLDDLSVANRGVLIGKEHRPGAYRVFARFSAEPLRMEEMRRWIEDRTEGAEPSGPRAEANFTVLP
jgi:hypothetical protein